MALIPTISTVIPNDWNSVVTFNRDTQRSLRKLGSFLLGPTSKPTFAGITFTGLTASRLLATDSSKALTSVANLASWVAGTTNRVTVANDGDGTITLSGPQDIHTAAAPTFANMTLNGSATYGIDLSGGTWASGDLNFKALAKMYANGTRVFVSDSTNFNMFSGAEAFNNADGQYNIGLGYQAGYGNDTTGGGGTNNIYIGYQSGHGNGATSTASNSVGIGWRSLYKITSGTYNFGIGPYSLYNCTSGSHNIGIGKGALFRSTTNLYNIGIGYETLYNAAAGHSTNVAIGYRAGYWTQGNNNVAIGYHADSRGVGAVAAHSNTTCIGTGSGYNNNTGSSNVFIGFYSGFNQTTNSNLLIIDNQDRSSAANELTNSLIYGVFNATPASQTLNLNAAVTIPHGLTLTGKTGVLWANTGVVTGDATLDLVGNLAANKTFNNAAYSVSFNFTNPTNQPTYDGAFEIQASGAFAGDLFHVHQHTGNPGATDLCHFEASDADVVILHLTHSAGGGKCLSVDAGAGETASILDTGAATLAGLTVSGLTASRLLATDGSKGLSSVSDLTAWIAGTANQVTVTSDGDGTVTLAGPQDLHTGASPTFAGLTVGSLAGVLKATAGVVSGSATLDDIADGTSYERVAAAELSSGIYKNATTAVKGIASFSSTNFSVTDGVVSLAAGGGLAHNTLTNLAYADAGHTGFEPTVAKGNLTAGSSKITIGGTGAGAVIGAGATVDVAEGNLTHDNLGGVHQAVGTGASPTFAGLSVSATKSFISLADPDYPSWRFLRIYGAQTANQTLVLAYNSDGDNTHARLVDGNAVSQLTIEPQYIYAGETLGESEFHWQVAAPGNGTPSFVRPFTAHYSFDTSSGYLDFIYNFGIRFPNNFAWIGTTDAGGYPQLLGTTTGFTLAAPTTGYINLNCGASTIAYLYGDPVERYFSVGSNKIFFAECHQNLSVVNMGVSTNHPLAIFTNNSEKLRITTTGNVGIGTATPATADASARTFQVGDRTVTQSTVGYQTNFSNNATYDGASWKYIVNGYSTGIRFNGLGATGDIVFVASPSGSAGNTITNHDTTDVKLVILNDGKVGVGVTAPNELLEVAGKVRADTAFNLNGTDGATQAAAAGTTCIPTAIAGGIVTAQSQVTYAADGTYNFDATSGKVSSITITKGMITGITTVP